MFDELDTVAGHATGGSKEILDAADAVELIAQELADRILAMGEDHAAALRLKAYLLKA